MKRKRGKLMRQIINCLVYHHEEEHFLPLINHKIKPLTQTLTKHLRQGYKHIPSPPPPPIYCH